MITLVQSSTAKAPAKVILFGEHAVNRGQLAIAAAIGLETRCRLSVAARDGVLISAHGRIAGYTRCELERMVSRVHAHMAARDYPALLNIHHADFFASCAYMLGLVLAEYPMVPGLTIDFTGNIPIGSGLGSGGAAHVALAVAVVAHFGGVGNFRRSMELAAEWAYSGDCLAHGGIASALDTQASLRGGIIEFREGQSGTPLHVPPGLRLVVGQTGISKGSTSAVNARVRHWLENNPARIHYFDEMGRVAGYARQALLAGDWRELGALMNLNHVLLERVGVSHPRLDELCVAALRGGALGAKLTGSGGGGCMIALVNSESEEPVTRALAEAGGMPLGVATGVPGARQEPAAPGSRALEPMAHDEDPVPRGYEQPGG